jgi:hypothetical protein
MTSSGRPASTTKHIALRALFLAALATSVPVVAAELAVSHPGEPFTLHVGERVQIPEAGFAVELVSLSYRQCPPNARCILADGPVVDFRLVEISDGTELFRGELRLAPPSRYPYFVLPMDSDGRTYARFSAHSATDWCASRASALEERDCWSRLADMTRQAEFCDRATETGKPAEQCYESLAEQTDDTELCSHVHSQVGWCGRQLAIADIEHAAGCASLLNWTHRTSCYQEVSRRFGGPEVCMRMPSERAQGECRQAVADSAAGQSD